MVRLCLHVSGLEQTSRFLRNKVVLFHLDEHIQLLLVFSAHASLIISSRCGNKRVFWYQPTEFEENSASGKPGSRVYGELGAGLL